jgi:LuxR family maltose regulon positive regulatory protein
MENLLLQTKLNIPVMRGNVVPRQRLIEQLNEELFGQIGFARRLTLISAPAGYGKTTAATEWLAGLEPKILWITLDEEDNDPVRFMSYLVAAFQQADASLGIRSLEMLQSPQPPQIEAFVTLLINDLSGKSQPLILVLDDYHFIQNPMIHKLVSYLLEHQPAHLHQVILTREDPLLPVARLLSRGQARELRQDDLRFTAPETADFLKHIVGLQLSREDVDVLQRRTEGWVAGLQLAAVSIQGHRDAHDFVTYFAGSNRYILDYLFEEVFTQQPVEVQEFLMRTSILNQLTGDLCDHIVERGESRSMLESLERSNLFILPLDPAREWYRYHRLFRDLLRLRLRIHQEGDETQLHMRACDWYQAHGFQSDAVHHALAAAEWKRAGELVLELNDSMMKSGEIVTLLGWFNQIPDSFMEGNPDLAIEYIWTLILTNQNELARTWLEQVENATHDDPQFLASITSAWAYLARVEGDVPRTIEYSQRALELVPDENKSHRSILAVNLGIAYWHSGRMEEALQALGEAQNTAQDSENYYALLAALIFLGRVEAVRGNLRKAAEMFQLAINKGISAPLTGLAHLDLGVVQYEWDDLGSCRDSILKGQEIIETSRNIEFQVAVYLLMVRLERALGNTESVRETLIKLQELEKLPDVSPPTCTRSKASRAEIAILNRDLPAAQELGEQIEKDVDAHPYYRFFGLLRERILIAEGEKEEASLSLIQKADQANQAGWVYGWVAVQILRALAAESQESGLLLIREVLERSKKEGFIRVYADQGQAIKPLLIEAAQRGVYPEYIGRILAAMRVKPETPTGIVEQLSEREIEVLRLVSAGLTNREIAEQLYLSPGTIKTHVHNICGKLGVANRTQAVMRARDLKLI